MTFPFEKERGQFPILKEKVQLSSCSQSAMSLAIEASINEYMDTWKYGGMDWKGWMERVEDAKSAFAKLIHAQPDEIAVLSSLSECASSVASALSYHEGRDGIVVTEMDFPCIGHVWLAQQARGAKVRFIPSQNNAVCIDDYDQYVDNRTLITSIPHVSYYNGFKQDLKTIANIVHSKGSYLFVDGYQSVGSVHIDVKDMDVDFLATGSQKYMLGIPGIAFLYVKKELADKLKPAITGWFGRVNPFAFDLKNLDYADGTRRFETGTPPMVNAYAAHAAIQMLLKIGVPKIESYLEVLSIQAMKRAKEIGLMIASPTDISQKASNTAIVVENAGRYESLMAEKGFIVSARNDVIRIAPHFYNTESEVLAAVDTLSELLNQRKNS